MPRAGAGLQLGQARQQAIRDWIQVDVTGQLDQIRVLPTEDGLVQF